jgi:protein phosphatase-4 regulatory subunit 3
MARTSLQPQEKDEFIPICVGTSVQLNDGQVEKQVSENTQSAADPSNDVNLLFLLGAILSDPGADTYEKSAALETLSVITIHDPAIIRRHCLEYTKARPDEKLQTLRPEPNDLNQIIFLCPPGDLMQSLLLVMSTESDAGVLLQTSEIIRIILDTEMMGDQNSLDGNELMNDENEGPTGNGTNAQNWNSLHEYSAERSEQNEFLSRFYEHYIQWLVSPFFCKILLPKAGFPLNASVKTMVQVQQSFRQRNPVFNIALSPIPSCAIRLSFTFEILSFCVRAHVYRMKIYVLRQRLLSTTLKILSQKSSTSSASDDRCLKLASLK